MKPIAIVAANNICYSPYIRFYSDILDKAQIPYILIYPDRNGTQDLWPGPKYAVPWNKSIPSIANYALYTGKVKKILRRNDVEKVVVLTSINAVYLSFYLKRKHKGKYIVDVRDFTYENNRGYALLEEKAFKYAGLRVISSKRFEDFLPRFDYLVCHNISVSGDPFEPKKVFHDGRIRITYVGSMAYEKNVRRLIELVKSDQRFEFYIYGGGPHQKAISDAVEEAANERVKYFGPYLPEEKNKIIEEASILFNVYGNNSQLLKCALSNKLYDSFYYHRMILNSTNTYMEEMSGIGGYSIDIETLMNLDGVYQWYMGVDVMKVAAYQDTMFSKVRKENEETKDRVSIFLRDEHEYRNRGGKLSI